jgi:hypothetical protein
MRDRSDTQAWQTILEQWRQSGKSQTQFCHEHGLKRGKFSYYKSRLSPRTPSRWREVHVQKPVTHSQMIFPNGVKLETSDKDLLLDLAIRLCSTGI